MQDYTDIKPYTSTSALDAQSFLSCTDTFPIEFVAPVVGMAPTFIRKVIGKKVDLAPQEILKLIELDAFSETFVPRSRIPAFLQECIAIVPSEDASLLPDDGYSLICGDALALIPKLPRHTVNCVVTSTPYWGTRLYEDHIAVTWADGETCPYGHEQTPEGFVRHSVELLYLMSDKIAQDGSVWWNVMDTFNTRTQIRSNAAEALRAMQGKDSNGWKDHACRRYSHGHSFLKDGELCGIPARIAERASRLGYWVKTMITWSKTGSLPEPQNSRVSRNLEYIIHLTRHRTPKFSKGAFRELPIDLGGRNYPVELDRLTDVWMLPTSSGRDGHGAQFPLALPGRCIGISTEPDDLVFDPFSGNATTGVAALRLGRKYLGIDISSKYIETSEQRIRNAVDDPSAMQQVLEV